MKLAPPLGPHRGTRTDNQRYPTGLPLAFSGELCRKPNWWGCLSGSVRQGPPRRFQPREPAWRPSPKLDPRRSRCRATRGCRIGSGMTAGRDRAPACNLPDLASGSSGSWQRRLTTPAFPHSEVSSLLDSSPSLRTRIASLPYFISWTIDKHLRKMEI